MWNSGIVVKKKKIAKLVWGGKDACQFATNFRFFPRWIDPVSSRRTNRNTANKLINYIMKLNKLSKTTMSLATTMGSLALSVSSANAAVIASFDYGNGTLQSGYTQGATNGAATDGSVTATTAGWTSPQSPGDASLNSNPQEDLYEDYLYGADSTVTLSGLANNTDYVITIYAYAGGNSGLAAGWYVGANDGTPDHTWSQTAQPWDEDVAKFDLNATSSGSGVILLSIDNTSKTSRINGLEISAVPEPTTTALLGLGGLALILRRRK